MKIMLAVLPVFVLMGTHAIPAEGSESKKSESTGSDTKEKKEASTPASGSDSKGSAAQDEHPKPSAASGKPTVVIETSMGTITAELWPDKAPASVVNFLKYVEDKHYDGLIFHRVIQNFMIQGGGMSSDFKTKTMRPPIKNEAKSDVKNERGTLAMARTGVIDSATSQFFVNVVDNVFLNHRDETPRGFGYCVFGKVTKGMDVVDKIRNVKTGARGPFAENVPLEDVVIKSIRLSK